MRTRPLLPAGVVLIAATLQAIGCNKGEPGPAASQSSESQSTIGSEDIGPTATGGNGNAATTSGAGATNGVSGTETPGAERPIRGIGNSPDSNSITTQPAGQGH